MVTRPAHYNARYKFDLSPRQREVLDHIARGQTNAEIADSLGVSLDGAKYHVREILAKLNVDSREEAAVYWRQYNRPSARLGRAFGSVFGLGALKSVAGAGALVAVGAAAAGIVVAINAGGGGELDAGSPIGDDDPPAAVTPSATPTPATPRVESPEEFARRISELVTAGKVSELLALSPPQTFVCPGPVPNGAGGPYPLCNGASPGEQRQGYVAARDASEATTVAAAPFEVALTEALGPSMQLASIGSGSAGSLLVAFDTGRAGEALYLAFKTAPGSAPALTAMGVSSANAGAILNGGNAVTVVGPASFQKAS